MQRKRVALPGLNQVDQFVRDISGAPEFDVQAGLWKQIIAARAMISLLYTDYSRGQHTAFFLAQLKKLQSLPLAECPFGGPSRDGCLQRLRETGSIGSLCFFVMRAIFFLCRIRAYPAAAFLLMCYRRLLEVKHSV